MAITRPSQPSTAPSPSVTFRAERSAATAGAPSRQPMLIEAARATRNGSWAASNSAPMPSFDSGGRLYGMCGSAPATVISPAKPDLRIASAARRPAIPAPTTTTRIARSSKLTRA